MSLMYIRNKSGPRMLPWGTPLVNGSFFRNLSDELKELEDQFISLKHKSHEEFVKKNPELNFLQAETEKLISGEHEERAAHLEEQIKNDRMIKFSSTLSASKKEPVGASVKTSSELIPPPSKKPFFDQLSGSNADGHVLPMQEVKKLKEEQERRARLRKLVRKMQKEAENKPKK